MAAYLAISIHPSLSSLCTTDYRFAKLTFLWWNNGVARADGEENRSRARKTSGDARAETREDQFDVNRSIVIRVNRLPLFVDGPRRPVEYNSRFVLLYFIPRVVEECRPLRRAASIYGRLLREATIAGVIDETGNLDPQEVEIDIFELQAYNSKLNMRVKLFYNCINAKL